MLDVVDHEFDHHGMPGSILRFKLRDGAVVGESRRPAPLDDYAEPRDGSLMSREVRGVVEALEAASEHVLAQHVDPTCLGVEMASREQIVAAVDEVRASLDVEWSQRVARGCWIKADLLADALLRRGAVPAKVFAYGDLRVLRRQRRVMASRSRWRVRPRST